jgi:hypothetical protein
MPTLLPWYSLRSSLAARRPLFGLRRLAGRCDLISNLQNEACTIGLFQGMFEKNTLTFNPGWDSACNSLPDFDDVREIQK